jgi:hypothetical protein
MRIFLEFVETTEASAARLGGESMPIEEESGSRFIGSLRCQRIGFSELPFSAAVILRLAISS